MAQISVTVNGNPYVLACGDGEEEHVSGLARSIDRRITNLVASVGQVGEARLLLMAALMVADELAEVSAQVQRLRTEPGAAERVRADEALTAEIEALADRIQGIAARIKAT